MKKTTRLILGITITAAIYFSAMVLSRLISIDNNIIPKSFVTHSTMLLLSTIAIIYFIKTGILKFEFRRTNFKYYAYAILITFAGLIVANVLASVFLSIFGFGIDPSGKGHSVAAEMSFLQILLFIFLYASICEEFLFRGFTQNFLQPLNTIRLTISKNVSISLPVVISGILFGLGHLILLSTETSGPMIFRIVIMTTIIGTIAGYFQEKHRSILPAIVIHMTANLPAVIMSIVM